MVAIATSFWGRTSSGAENVAWLTGAALERQLQRPVSGHWSGMGLRNVLDNVSHQYHVAVLLDRRVDPGYEVNVRLEQTPLRTALGQIAERDEIGFCMAGPVAYFGPSETAKRLRTLLALAGEEAQKAPPELKRRLFDVAAMKWDDLAEPQQLLKQLAAQAKLRIDGLERVPHDLWAAGDLPPLPWFERVMLVATQFDLTFSLGTNAESIALVPLPARILMVRSYEGGKQPEQTAKQFASLAPAAEVKVADGRVWVRGLLEDHERLAARRGDTGQRAQARPQKTTKSPPSTLTVVNKPLQEVLDTLAGHFKLQLKVDRPAIEGAGISLDKLVSLSVKNGTVDDLFQAALKPAGLSFRRQDNVVEIFPAR